MKKSSLTQKVGIFKVPGRRRKYYRPEMGGLDIPTKANRILNFILIAIVLIIFRIWHLAVIQYDERKEESRKPQRRVVIEAAKRGTIRDRFNIPLAINKIQYNASILYSQLREVPSIVWETDSSGKRVKKFKRKEYITHLANLLGKELGLDPERLEDLIHSKASFYYSLPFVVKEDLSEEEYYRLKMMEKDWPGVHVQKLPKRYYPLNKVGADIIGYMGAINKNEYEKIIEEMKTLQSFFQKFEEGEDVSLPEPFTSHSEAEARLKDLEEHAYTIHDYVGKTGVEGRFEEVLRGFYGKKSYYSDARGNFLRELPDSRESLSGQRLLLTISAELQEYAEQLLAQNERIREARVSGADVIRQTLLALRQPWIKGGAIVAMDPRNGDVLALASYPRFDPNDFINSGNPDLNKQKRANIQRWFESESYIADIWNQKRNLEKEAFHDEKRMFYDEKLPLNWENYLNILLPSSNPVHLALKRLKTLKNAILLQQGIQKIIDISEGNSLIKLLEKTDDVKLVELKKEIEPFFDKMTTTYDKLLLTDLCRIAVFADRFTPELIEAVGNQDLTFYRDASASMSMLRDVTKGMSRDLFHVIDFKEWRAENEKSFLKEKREIEKQTHRYPKPYLDYLDNQEKEMFQAFWNENGWSLMMTFLTGYQNKKISNVYLDYFKLWHQELEAGAHSALYWREAYQFLSKALKSLSPSIAIQYLQTMRSYDDLTRPLLGKYRHLRKENNQQLEKHLAAAFYPRYGFGYGRSQGYRQAATQGSIFKLVTAHEALIQRYRKLNRSSLSQEELNPLEMTDSIFRHGKDLCVGYHDDGKPIPQQYKGGRMLKSYSSRIGKLDLLKALEVSSNPYFSLLAGDVLEFPDDLTKAAKNFSFGSRTGIDLPSEIAGNVPEDLLHNRTGLYAMAIGQHSLVVTPLQTAVFLSTIANGGKVLKPKIVNMTIGKKPLRHQNEEAEHDNQAYIHPSVVKKEVFMPSIVRRMLLEGMRRVVTKQQKEALGSLSRFYHDYPEAISDYVDLKDNLVGKTSTSESMENIDMDHQHGTNLYTHVWFGGISFRPEIMGKNKETFVFHDKFGQPDLVVVVYLRYGAFGKEAAPVAAQIVKKWHEIQSRFVSDK